jgi:hypothetical protein
LIAETERRGKGMKKKTLLSFLNAVAIFTLLFLLFSCSTNPSGADGTKALESRYKNLVKVVSFKETNAQEGELLGVKIYSMKYEAEIEFTDDVLVKNMMGEISISKGKPGDGSFVAFMGGKPFKKGTKTKITGELTFSKTKNGWQIE